MRYVTRLKSPFDSVVLARTPPWARRAGMVFKRYHRPESGGQLIAQGNFGEAAASAFGRTGFSGSLPAVAAHVQGALAGRAALGAGVAASNAQRNRMDRHNGVGARMQALRARGQAKLGGGGAISPFG